MRDEFFELSALEVYECGKGWREATNDVCEAIDFCNYYADCALLLEQPDGADVPITGTFELTMPYTILVSGSSPEQVSFDIYVVDEAGNESNVVSSPDIQVNPQ